jgi:hypothetical protein
MKYYINKLDIFEIEEFRRYTDEISTGKGKPKKKRTWIAYNVIRQLGGPQSRLSGVHLLQSEQDNVFDSLTQARDRLVSQLEDEIKKLMQLTN